MVDSETIETKISDKKEEFEEEVEDETFDDEDDLRTKYEERKEKGKNIADNVLNDLYASIDDFKEYIKNVQKNADQKYADYKNSVKKGQNKINTEGLFSYEIVKKILSGRQNDNELYDLMWNNQKDVLLKHCFAKFRQAVNQIRVHTCRIILLT